MYFIFLGKLYGLGVIDRADPGYLTQALLGPQVSFRQKPKFSLRKSS